MKKLFLILSVTLLTTTTFAQIRFAPEAGLNMAMQSVKSTVQAVPMTTTAFSRLSPGASVGVMADLRLMKSMYLQTGVFYFFNNIKYSSDIDLSSYELGTPSRVQYDRVHSFRLPVFLMYKSGYEGSGRFIAGAGPYLAYNFSASRSLRVPVVTYDPGDGKVSGYMINNSTADLPIGNEAYKDALRPLDLGLNACIGYESNVGLYFRGTFSYSLLNQDPANTDQYRVRNWGMGISIGYLLGKDNW